MDLNLVHNFTLLRALMIFAIGAAFLVFAGIVVCYQAWRDAKRRNTAHTGKPSISRHGEGNSTGSIA